MVCRNEARGNEARMDIISKTNNQNVELEVADVSRPSEIKELVKKIERVDILVNNAGVLLNEPSQTKDGIEATFATNTLGTFCLTEELLPLLSAQTDPRVV